MHSVCVWLQFRFALLNLAAMEAPLILKVKEGLFGDDCVFIANDWHGALVPVYLAAKYRPHGVYQNSRSILAVHNLRHQVSHMLGSFRGPVTPRAALLPLVQLRCFAFKHNVCRMAFVTRSFERTYHGFAYVQRFSVVLCNLCESGCIVVLSRLRWCDWCAYSTHWLLQ